MSDITINTPNCSVSNTGNSQIPTCYIDPARTAAIIGIPKGTIINEGSITSTATLLTYLNTQCALASRALRWWPISNIAGMEDKSTEGDVYTTPYGDVEQVNQGRYVLDFLFRKGGLCYYKLKVCNWVCAIMYYINRSIV